MDLPLEVLRRNLATQGADKVYDGMVEDDQRQIDEGAALIDAANHLLAPPLSPTD